MTTSPETNVYVTGHSLGGALTPAIGLWLENTKSTWDPGSNATVNVYAFAGATPGDKAFANYFNGLFIGDALVVVNNTHDVVPLAWKPDQRKDPARRGEVEPGPADRPARASRPWSSRPCR